ncbi:MAG TPA: adenylate/guanylate cyclase domain-containing protein [Thermoanaerobaculia bacterium]|nr:adenylate/guanylate cyclase domain-containing protein [Thermoanaerobaculia bacterium]
MSPPTLVRITAAGLGKRQSWRTMAIRRPIRLIGFSLGAGYWFLESLLHTFVFRSGTFVQTLACMHDPNELWMRLIIVVLFAGFGVIAQRDVDAERHLREEARQIARLRHIVEEVQEAVSGADEAAAGEDDLAMLLRTLSGLPSILESRFRELHALLAVTREINRGMLFDQVLEKAYDVLRSVIPYDRLGVALIEDHGATARACWARSDGARIILGRNYSAPLHGSSLEAILQTGEPRILNDLERYLDEHPASVSTRMMVMEGIRSSLTCPLVSSGKPIGFIFFSSRAPDVYRNVHVDVFRLIAGHLSIVVEKGQMYQQILIEKQKSEALLLNVMPERIAERLRSGDTTVSEVLDEVTLLFADIVDFTPFASRYPPERVVSVLRDVFVLFDDLCDRYGVEKIKTIGDEYMAISGTRGSSGRLAARDMAHFALHLVQAVKRIRYPDGKPIRIRVGLHTGRVVAGVIGQKKFGYDVWGDAVNVASRMQSTGDADQIQVTDAVYQLLKDDFELEARGPIAVKGKGTMLAWFLIRPGASARPIPSSVV